MTLLRWLTFLLGSQTDSHCPALLDLFISSDASICSTMAFPPLGNSDHVAVSVSFDFPSNSQQNAPFHCIAYDYSHADWDGLFDHLRDVPWEDMFKLSASSAASEFCEDWVQVGIDVYIPHHKYHVKPHLSPWFSAACAADIVHRNHFFHLYQKDKSSESKVKFRQALLHSVLYFFFLYRSPSSSLCMAFDSISSNIDEVLSINPSANVFVFGDFNAHLID